MYDYYVIINGDGGCSFWQPVQADSQPKSSGLVLGRRPLGAILHTSNEPGELSQWLCHDDSTINIVVLIIIIIIHNNKYKIYTYNNTLCRVIITMPLTAIKQLDLNIFPICISTKYFFSIMLHTTKHIICDFKMLKILRLAVLLHLILDQREVNYQSVVSPLKHPQPWSPLTIMLLWHSFLIITRGQSNLTKSASRGAHSPVRGHPRGSKVVPLNSWGRVSY